MSLMHCAACGTNYGGPTMEAFGCCPLCLGTTGHTEILVRLEDADADLDLPAGPLASGGASALRDRPAAGHAGPR